MAKKTKEKESKRRVALWLLIRVALVLFIVFCVVSIVTIQNGLVEKQQQIANLDNSIDTLTAKNEELADLIESDDISRYMEKLAVEKNGYAYPDERRYYDTSHN